MKKLKTKYSEMVLECGFLTERKEDERFARWGKTIVSNVINHWKANPSNQVTKIPGYDLIVDITSDPSENSHGWFTREKQSKTPVIVINAAHLAPILYKKKEWVKLLTYMKRILHHEVIHYINYLNYNNKEKILYRSKNEFNNDQEYNAYFHQLRMFMRDGMNILKRQKGKFEDTYGYDAQEFIEISFGVLKGFDASLVNNIRDDKVFYKKWLKRLYQLYFELRDVYYHDRIKSYTQGTL